MADFVIEPGKPVRFLAVEWREHWEFDHPTALLEPVVRYSPNGTNPETMIEDGVIDVLCDDDVGKASRSDLNGGDKKEFDWRGWDIEEVRQVAEARLRGEKVAFGTGYVGVLEQWVVFDPADECGFRYVPRPA